MTLLLRRSLLLLLMLSLPFSAVAGPLLGMFDPCPMQSHEHSPATAMEPADDHCGHQAPAPSKVVKLCKSGHECQSPSLLILSWGKPVTLVASSPLWAHVPSESPSLNTADVWRPPQV